MKTSFLSAPTIVVLLTSLCACGAGVVVQNAGSGALLAVASLTTASTSATPTTSPARSTATVPSAVSTPAATSAPATGLVCAVPIDAGATESCAHCAL